MTFADFFAHYWWLMFPVFGMVMAIMGMFQSERQQRSMIDLIKTYTDQGKEPPPELVKLASQSLQAEAEKNQSSNSSDRAWSFIVFAALSAGFGTGYYFIRAEEWSWAFLIVAVTMGVMALGALVLLVTRKN